MNIRLKVIVKKVGGSKLSFVKLIKDQTGLGLKDSKDWCDDAFLNIGKEKILYVRSISDFKKGLREMVPDFVIEINDRERQRQLKLVSIGIGDDSDRIDILSEEYSDKLIQVFKNSTYDNQYSNVEQFFKKMLSQIDSQELDKLISSYVSENNN